MSLPAGAPIRKSGNNPQENVHLGFGGQAPVCWGTVSLYCRSAVVMPLKLGSPWGCGLSGTVLGNPQGLTVRSRARRGGGTRVV